MKHYLWILKTTHGGADMDTCLEMAKGALDGSDSLSVCVSIIEGLTIYLYSQSHSRVQS